MKAPAALESTSVEFDNRSQTALWPSRAASDQALPAVFIDKWRMRTAAREYPGLTMERLIVDASTDW